MMNQFDYPPNMIQQAHQISRRSLIIGLVIFVFFLLHKKDIYEGIGVGMLMGAILGNVACRLQRFYWQLPIALFPFLQVHSCMVDREILFRRAREQAERNQYNPSNPKSLYFGQHTSRWDD